MPVGPKDGRSAHQDLVALQAALTNPHFDRENHAFRQGGKPYRYASLAAHLDAVRPVVTKHGFAIMQLIQGKDGTLEVATQLVHESGTAFTATIQVPLPAGGPHALMGMVTYLRRGQMASLLGIVGDDDDDGNAAAEPQQGARMPHKAPEEPKVGVTVEELETRLEAIRARHGVEKALAGKSPKPAKAGRASIVVGRVKDIYLNSVPKPHKIVLEDNTILKAWNKPNVSAELNRLIKGEEYRFYYEVKPGQGDYGPDMFLTGELFEVAKPGEVTPEEIPF